MLILALLDSMAATCWWLGTSWLSKPPSVCAGIRNAAGFGWHPAGRLLFSGMERDHMGNDRPDDILAAADAVQPGVDFNWPYCHWWGGSLSAAWLD
jgi:glucose/arabinose dehydrogenase